MNALRIESVRSRLTLFYVSVLAAALIVVDGLIYVLLARSLYSGVDDNLHAVMQVTTTSLTNDLGEGQDFEDAARSTAAELSSSQQMLAIYDGSGRLLAEGGRDDDVAITLPALGSVPTQEAMLLTVFEAEDDDRHRLGVRRVNISPFGAAYVVVVGSSLEEIDEELESLRGILAYVVPIALASPASADGFLPGRACRRSPQWRSVPGRFGVENLGGRLPVANPRDELGQLADTFNDLLGRLEASLTQQRQFTADASHELRTPVATSRTAATVALQQPHRDEDEYRETLAIIEQQTVRLSRVVDDMFTLARADAGNYPVHRSPMYLDEVVDDVVRAARVLAATKGVALDLATTGAAAFTGDEDLVRRLVVNLLDNAVRHGPAGSTVKVDLQRTADGYVISISDQGAAFRRKYSSAFSSAFTASTPPASVANGPTTARGWDSPWRAGSRTSTTAMSHWSVRRRRGPRSPRFFVIGAELTG